MLLLHQAGSVKIGEIVRYTVTYTPAEDRILPSPHHLHLKIKNTCALALRAAFVHGPYTLYTAAYPANFHPNSKFEHPRTYGVPEFEPNLKAGGSFYTQLAVPEEVRKSAGQADRHGNGAEKDGQVKSVSWIVEVTSQVIFSNSAAVHYEILLGRDEKSLSIGFGSSLSGSSTAQAVPGQVSDHQQSLGAKDGHHNALAKGVFSKAIRLKVEDTATLWNTPRMPEWDDAGKEGAAESNPDAPTQSVTGGDGHESGHRQKRQKKVHLVVVTHGLHSNLGADMLFLKESIDEAAAQAKVDARIRKSKQRHKKRGEADTGEKTGGNSPPPAEDEEEDEEEVIVRGFSGNSVRTERGIKYLGKRLAKYVLQMTYPDQPYKPATKNSAAVALSHAIKPESGSKPAGKETGQPTHQNSSIIKAPHSDTKLAYKITKISFIAHSLGGLVQMYAVAYIQKHSPEFFDIIEPINFISLASPFLGLSNENPMYVKFALDFGLVGRTGQDLGLTWRAPTIARSGWGALVSGIGESAHKKIDGETAPESKPLLRILPTGPAHIVLKKFRNRTVYSNVVNDGVVPLRTSCLLFLDWQGLGRVEKARRENGLVGTMASWGWAEITGQLSSNPTRRTFSESTAASDSEEAGNNTPTKDGHGGDVPQPSEYANQDDDARSLKSVERPLSAGARQIPSTAEPTNNAGPLASIIKFFNPAPAKPASNHPKQKKIYKRSQTLRVDSETSSTSTRDSNKEGGKATTGDAEFEDPDQHGAPPRTTFFESAGDIIKPPLPPVEFLIDPSSRPRTIFHDRVYHPEDIPPPPLKRRPTSSMLRRRSSLKTSPPTPGVNHTDSSLSAKDYDDTRHTNPDKSPHEVVDGSAMKVEEKIARAYHRDLSWRKVLVRLEPDAHNNMIVRRMFANAYGWPVIKHLCDTHFGDSDAAHTRDEDESNAERAKGVNEAPDKEGGETKADPKPITSADRTDSETREARDSVPALHSAPKPGSLGRALAGDSLNLRVPSPPGSKSSGYESETAWSERDWADSEYDSDDPDDIAEKTKRDSSSGGWNWTEAIAGKGVGSPKGTDKAEIDQFLGKKVGLESGVGGDAVEEAKSPGSEVEIGMLGDAHAARILSGDEPGLREGLLDAVGRLNVAASPGESLGKGKARGGVD